MSIKIERKSNFIPIIITITNKEDAETFKNLLEYITFDNPGDIQPKYKKAQRHASFILQDYLSCYHHLKE